MRGCIIVSTQRNEVNINIKISREKITSFAGEDIVRFAAQSARFVRFDVLSTTGKRYGKPPCSDASLKIAEISIFEGDMK